MHTKLEAALDGFALHMSPKGLCGGSFVPCVTVFGKLWDPSFGSLVIGHWGKGGSLTRKGLKQFSWDPG